MEFGKRHDATDSTDFVKLLIATDLLRKIYGETDGVMDFRLNCEDSSSETSSAGNRDVFMVSTVV